MVGDPRRSTRWTIVSRMPAGTDTSSDHPRTPRIATRFAPERPDQALIGSLPGGRFDEPPDDLLLQTTEHDQPRGGLTCQIADRRCQGMLGRQLDIAKGADEQQTGVAQLTGQETEEEDRGGIGCMEVVQDDHQARIAGGVAEKSRRRIEELKSG